MLLNLPDGIQNLSISTFPGPVLYVEVRQTVLLAPLLALYQGLPVQDWWLLPWVTWQQPVLLTWECFCSMLQNYETINQFASDARFAGSWSYSKRTCITSLPQKPHYDSTKSPNDKLITLSKHVRPPAPAVTSSHNSCSYVCLNKTENQPRCWLRVQTAVLPM